MTATNDGDHARIEGIVLGQNPAGAGELAQLERLTWHAGKPAPSKARIAPRS
jgi:hypothetical protein